MNVVRVMGGLGNQMFQYAFGKVVGASYDLSWFRSYTNHAHPRPYRLGKFNTKIKENAFLPQETIEERKVGFDMNLLNKKNCNFYGYWQWLGYYKAILPILRQELTLKEAFYTEEFIRLRNEICSCDSLSIHVRRGDYLTQAGFHDLPLRYYFEAVSALSRRDCIFIFSDDIPWCKSKFKQDYFQEKITFVQLDDYLSFELMKNCRKNITANSTFSWWAAYLNDNPDKAVVTPREWLCNDIQETNGNEVYFPKEWIKIQGNAFQNI
jgi:hypothetical protein